MADKLPWFPFYATDWLSDPTVRTMSSRQKGWYMDLLCFAWQEHGLSSAIAVLQRLTSYWDDHNYIDKLSGQPEPFNELKEEFEEVVEMFSLELGEDRVTHPKLEEIRIKSENDSIRKAENGRKGGLSRAKAVLERSLSKNQATLKHRAYGSGSISDSVVLNGKGSGENHGNGDYSGYEVFVANWPEQDRRGVDEGARAWITLVDAGTLVFSEVMAGLLRWKASQQWAKKNGDYIPAIDKWLISKKWKDNPKPKEDDNAW